MISVITASSRDKNSLRIVEKSLAKQDFKDFEWLVDTEVIKNKGDFYGLNKAWNRLLKRAKGELVVSIVDRTEVPFDALSWLWKYYQEDNMSCVNGVGKQYDGKELVWTDPRIEWVKGEGVCAMPPEFNEFRLTSFPLKAAYEVGGLDEEYDKVVANSEKEFAIRMWSAGYQFYLDKELEFKFYKHEEHGKIWDEKYKKSCKMLDRDARLIMSRARMKLNYL